MKSSSTLDGILKPIAGLFLLAAFVALLAVWHGYVLSVLWGWFVVTGFGAQPISIPLAIGVSLLVGSCVATPKKEWDAADPLWKTFAHAFARPAMTLFIGWIVTKFI